MLPLKSSCPSRWQALQKIRTMALVSTLGRQDKRPGQTWSNAQPQNKALSVLSNQLAATSLWFWRLQCVYMTGVTQVILCTVIVYYSQCPTCLQMLQFNMFISLFHLLAVSHCRVSSFGELWALRPLCCWVHTPGSEIYWPKLEKRGSLKPE